MTAVNQARFTIDGSPSEDPVTGDPGYVAAFAQTLDCTLEISPSSALSVTFSVFDPTDESSPLASYGAPNLTWVGSGLPSETLVNPNGTAQIIMPGADVESYVIRCTASMSDATYIYERIVAIRAVTVPPIRKTVPAEVEEYYKRGWSDEQNKMVDAITGIVVPVGIDSFGSAGTYQATWVIDAGGGMVNVSAGTGWLRTTASVTGLLVAATWLASAGNVIPANSTRYLGVEYNGGAPQVVSRVANTFNGLNDFLMATVYNEAGTLHILEHEQAVQDGLHGCYARFLGNFPMSRDERVGGLIVTDAGVRNVAMSAGILYDGLSTLTISAINTSGAGRFDYYYRDGIGGWTKVATQTQYSSTQYDNNTGVLATYAAAHYGITWWYLESDGHLVGLYGQGDYASLAEAEDATPPATVPGRITSHGILLGRTIVLKSAASATEVESAFAVEFGLTGVTSHNSLGGLQGGGAGEYYHLTAAHHTDLTDGLTCTSHVHTLDQTYRAAVATVTVDTHDVTWNLTGAFSHVIGLAGCTGALDGFQITNGTDFLSILRTDVNKLAVTSQFETFDLQAAGAITINGLTTTIEGIEHPTVYNDLFGPTGFTVAGAGGVLSWDDGTFTFTITGNHTIYLNGVKTTKPTASIAVTDATGLYWIYYDAAGTLSQNTVYPGTHVVLIASVYWNTTTNLGLLADERHGIIMDGATHTLLHETVGTRYVSGLGGSFLAATFSIDPGSIADEDITYTWLGAATQCNVLYKNGSANWEWDAGATVYYKLNGANLRYNNGNVLADAGPNQYVAAWIFASGVVGYPITAIMGQRVDTTIADARANNTYESLALGTLPYEEMKLLYRVILRNTGAPPTVTETQDLRSVSNLPAGTYVASSHGVLTGLTADDHTQYALLAGRDGGQTLIGGTAVSDDLILRATSGVGAAGSKVELQVGNNGAIVVGTADFDGTTIWGSATTAAATTLRAGTGAMTFTAGGIFDVNAVGAVSIDSSGSTISIGGDANTGAISLGNSASARVVTVGSLNTTSSLVLQSGTGLISFTDGYKAAGGYAGSLYLALNAAEYTTFETYFGEVSLINAINQASALASGWVSAENLDIDIGTETVDTFVTPVGGGLNGGCFWVYFAVDKDDHTRRTSGYISVDWYAGTTNVAVMRSNPVEVEPVFTATAVDTGTGTNCTVTLLATVTSNNWSVKVRRAPYMVEVAV